MAACIDRERFEKDLRFIAQPREPGSDHWQAVQDLCAPRLESLGFEVERQRYGTGVNVIGRRGGASAPPVLLGAHYDHIADCPGADDNATGVAVLLELARAWAALPMACPVQLVAFDLEESGCYGSLEFIRNFLMPAYLDKGMEIQGVLRILECARFPIWTCYFLSLFFSSQ